MSTRYLCSFCVAVGAFLAGTQQGHATLDYQLAAGSSTGIGKSSGAQTANGTASVDGFEMVQGRVQLITIGQYVRSQLAYGISATTWFRGSQSDSLSHSLLLASTIEAGPTTIITLDASATLTQMSMLQTSTTDPQTVGPRPAGNQNILTLQAGEGVSWQPSASWRLSESVQGRLARPWDGSTTASKSLAAEAQLGYVWARDLLGIRGRVGEMWPGSNAAMRSPSQFAEASLGWTHQWSEEWSHDVAAGLTSIRTYGSWRGLSPLVSAGLVWRRLGNTIELRAGQGAESNIYVGTSYERRFVGLRITTPLNQLETLRLMLDGNAEHDWTKLSDGTEQGATVYAGRVALSWQLGSYFNAFLEYSIRDQRAPSASATSPAPTPPAPSMFVSLRRQIAMLTIEARYPGLF